MNLKTPFMAGLGPAIHETNAVARGCPAQGRARTTYGCSIVLRGEARLDLAANIGAPFLHRLEAVAVAAEGFGLAIEFVFRLFQVDLEAERLRHVPRRVAEH